MLFLSFADFFSKITCFEKKSIRNSIFFWSFVLCSAQSRNRYHSRMVLAQCKNSHLVAQSLNSYFAQSRYMDQVRICVILFYPL